MSKSGITINAEIGGVAFCEFYTVQHQGDDWDDPDSFDTHHNIVTYDSHYTQSNSVTISSTAETILIENWPITTGWPQYAGSDFNGNQIVDTGYVSWLLDIMYFHVWSDNDNVVIINPYELNW